ncbi:MAG: hypothetical protein KDA89_25030, partial [Planctomycetaceae bacterium]|nr:hypothetical protein [Planctomycetaceae bacterium]
ELRISPNGSADVTTVPLQPVGDQQWSGSVPLTDAGIYKVHLVSADTGFENRFSPKYEIRPLADLVPRVGFQNLTETSLLLPPNDILTLSAYAEDDLPLVNLEQQVSVNGSEWTSRPLETKSVSAAEDSSGAGDGSRTTGLSADGRDVHRLQSDWQWDLLPYGLKSGDQVLTKLSATDRQGKVGESVSLRIVISSPEFTRDRHALMAVKSTLVEPLLDFQSLLEQQKTTAVELLEQQKDPQRSVEQRRLDRATLKELAERQKIRAAELLEETERVTRRMPAGTDAYDLELVGRMLIRLQKEHASFALATLEAMLPPLPTPDDPPTDRQKQADKQATQDMAELKKAFERSADDGRALAQTYQRMATHNFLTAAAFDMHLLFQQQSQVVNHPTQSWDRLQRHETVALSQLQQAEQLMRDHRPWLHESHQGRILQQLQWAQIQREHLESALESEDKLSELQAFSKRFLEELRQRQNFDTMDGGLPGQLASGRRDWENRLNSLSLPLEEMSRTVAEFRKLSEALNSARDSQQIKAEQEKLRRVIAVLELQHRERIDQLSGHRQLT